MESSAPVSRVLFRPRGRCPSFIYYARHHASPAFYPPSVFKWHESHLKGWTGNPQPTVYMNLQHPAGTARRSPAAWWSLTPPSHPYLPSLRCYQRKRQGAVVLFFLNQLSPAASTFRSGLPCAARTFLSHPPEGGCQRQAEPVLSGRKGSAKM